MPYSYETQKLKIQRKDNRTVKLTEEDKIAITHRYFDDEISIHRIADEFNVSRRTIQFILFPERLAKNRQLRAERGGSTYYYDKEKHKEYMKTHRHYKKELYDNKQLV